MNIPLILTLIGVVSIFALMLLVWWPPWYTEPLRTSRREGTKIADDRPELEVFAVSMECLAESRRSGERLRSRKVEAMRAKNPDQAGSIASCRRNTEKMVNSITTHHPTVRSQPRLRPHPVTRELPHDVRGKDSQRFQRLGREDDHRGGGRERHHSAGSSASVSASTLASLEKHTPPAAGERR